LEETKPDIEISALGAGCLTSCLAAALGVAVLAALLAAGGVPLGGVEVASVPPGLKFVGLLVGLAGDVLVGFVTARTATQAKNLHVIILGGLMMLVGLLGLVLPSGSGRGPDGYMLVHWFLIIPLMLIGAGFAGPAQEGRLE
jgi:hypothetical protein